jgi:UTP--glucose-1-phosphate uridylyltransferase
MQEVKKAILLMAGLGTRLLPLTKVIQKEFLPLVDRPILHYLLEELLASEIKEVIFVLPPGRREVIDYFKKRPFLEKILKERKKFELLEEIKKIEELAKNFSFTFLYERQPLGDGHAVLQAKKTVGEEPSVVLFCDDLLDSKIPATLQLLKTFRTCQKPVIALKKLPKEKISLYGIAGTEKIASRLHKIKKIVEKPPADKAPSDLGIVGRYILIPEVFDYLKRQKPNQKGEIILADAFEAMIKDGKMIYGYELEGEWLECGDLLRWMKTNLYFSLKHPKYGQKLKEYLKEIL